MCFLTTKVKSRWIQPVDLISKIFKYLNFLQLCSLEWLDIIVSNSKVGSFESVNVTLQDFDHCLDAYVTSSKSDLFVVFEIFNACHNDQQSWIPTVVGACGVLLLIALVVSSVVIYKQWERRAKLLDQYLVGKL